MQNEFATHALSDFSSESTVFGSESQTESLSENQAEAVSSDSTLGEADQSDTEAQEGALGESEVLTFEYRDDPLKAFIREIEDIAAQDPEAALTLAMMARDEKTFDSLSGGEARLEEKIKELLTLNNVAPEMDLAGPELEGDDLTPTGSDISPAPAIEAPNAFPAFSLKPGRF